MPPTAPSLQASLGLFVGRLHQARFFHCVSENFLDKRKFPDHFNPQGFPLLFEFKLRHLLTSLTSNSAFSTALAAVGKRLFLLLLLLRHKILVTLTWSSFSTPELLFFFAFICFARSVCFHSNEVRRFGTRISSLFVRYFHSQPYHNRPSRVVRLRVCSFWAVGGVRDA